MKNSNEIKINQLKLEIAQLEKDQEKLDKMIALYSPLTPTKTNTCTTSPFQNANHTSKTEKHNFNNQAQPFFSNANLNISRNSNSNYGQSLGNSDYTQQQVNSCRPYP
jgi:hypothetical protein